LYGFDLTKLTEKVPANVPLGNQELAIEIRDGGDGNFDEKDIFLFYAPGNLRWEKDVITQHWNAKKLHYSDTAYYFLTIGENGKRIDRINNSTNATQKVNTYTAHFIWEQDSVNLLNSGKLWLGAPMGQGVGKTATVNYSFNSNKLQNNAPVLFDAQFVSTNYNQNAQFDIKWNNTKIKTISVQPVSGLVYDAVANSIVDSFSYWPVQNNNTSNNLTIQYNAPQGSTGYIDYVAMHLPMQLSFGDNNYFVFNGQEDGQNYEYQIANADTTSFVWDISNPLQPLALSTTNLNNNTQFNIKGGLGQQFIALKQNAFESIVNFDTLANQNITNSNLVEYLIIAPSGFQKAATQLKNFHEQTNGFKVTIVDPVKMNFLGA
jgi:hypothetical protein